jgi:hypothetical protein
MRIFWYKYLKNICSYQDTRETSRFLYNIWHSGKREKNQDNFNCLPEALIFNQLDFDPADKFHHF